MKRNVFLLLGLFAFALATGESCKSKKDKTATEQTPTTPVEINSDEQLRTSVNTVVINYPDVKADINNGVITLTGSIKQAELQLLISRIQELKPKKVENKLVIQ